MMIDFIQNHNKRLARGAAGLVGVIALTGCGGETSSAVIGAREDPLSCDSAGIYVDYSQPLSDTGTTTDYASKLFVRASRVDSRNPVHPDTAIVREIGGSYREEVALTDDRGDVTQLPEGFLRFSVTIVNRKETKTCGEFSGIPTDTGRRYDYTQDKGNIPTSVDSGL